MSVYTHPNKPGWQMIKIFHGKEKPEYIPFPGTKEEAQIHEKELRGITDRSDPMFLDKLPEFKIAYKNEVMSGTYDDFGFAWLRIEPFFKSMKIRHITPLIIEQYKAFRLSQVWKGKPISKRTVNRELSYLSKYLLFSGSGMKPVKFRKKDCAAPPAEPMSMDAMDEIVALLKYPVKQLVQLMEYNGIRRTEAFTIKSADADKDGKYIRIWGKGGKWRIAPIEEPQLQKDIIEAKKARPDGYLFPNMRKGKFHLQPYKDIRKTLKAAAVKAGVTQRVYNHLFRHSFATALVEEGENMAIIQELLGHADIKQTREYTKVTSNHTRRGTARLIDRNPAITATDQNQ
ncbi:MAG: tyrosine-type recombinase/integrase [Deltaproteobacteria bacterium]|nr:tyrosine-type recombinase/integrase [Deltaproteobacteria bacterium]